MLNIDLVKAFDDNYIFILRCNETGTLAVVDPGDATPVLHSLKEGEIVHDVLLTHHHGDHVGGVSELVNVFAPKVYGCESDLNRLPCVTNPVHQGDVIQIGASLAKVLYLRGHTKHHIAYYFEKDKALFCGDTLFVGGCGRLFEGTPDDMFNSMVELKNLPDDVRVYCAHEYTLSNYEFALSVFPNDVEIMTAQATAMMLRAQDEPTVPSTIRQERKSNVFLRAENVSEFARLRDLKDNF